MQIVLALLAAFSWGSGNFTMGMAGRRAPARVTVVSSFAAGLAGSLIFFAIQRPSITANAFVWGFAAGAAQGCGWALFSAALSAGRISLVAPLTSAVAAGALYLCGVVSGDRVSWYSVVGAALVFAAIMLLSRPNPAVPGEVSSQQSSSQQSSGSGRDVGIGAPALAVFAGLLFTAQFLALHQAGDKAGAVVMVGSRLAAVALIGTSLLIWRKPADTYRSALPFAGPAGLVILVGDLFYLSALSVGPLTTASVLGGLHPVTTIVLARIIVNERVGRSHVLGIGSAVVGTALIVLG